MLDFGWMLRSPKSQMPCKNQRFFAYFCYFNQLANKRPYIRDFGQHGPQLDSQNPPKLLPKSIPKPYKKQCKKSLIFSSILEATKVRKRSPKPLQNGAQDGPKSNPEGRSRRKWEKCKNEQHYKVLVRFLLPQGIENRRKHREKSDRKRFEVGVHFRR